MLSETDPSLRFLKDPNKSSLQVDPSGSLQAPASKSRIARSDVIALAVAAATPMTTTMTTDDSDSLSPIELTLPKEKSYTLAIRGVGEMEDGKIQGSKEDGYRSAMECFVALSKDGQPATESLPQQQSSSISLEKKIQSKPYGLAVAVFAYSLTAIAIKVTTQLVKGICSLFFKVAALVS